MVLPLKPLPHFAKLRPTAGHFGITSVVRVIGFRSMSSEAFKKGADRFRPMFCDAYFHLNKLDLLSEKHLYLSPNIRLE
jgi:hypothetical protein